MAETSELDQGALRMARKRVERMMHSNGWNGAKLTVSVPMGCQPPTSRMIAEGIVRAYLDALPRTPAAPVQAEGGETWWAVWSPSGAHVGLWSDKETAEGVLAEFGAGGTIKQLSALEAYEMAAAHEAKWRSLSAHQTCACSYDAPDDICDHHSPKLAALQRDLDQAREALRPFLGDATMEEILWRDMPDSALGTVSVCLGDFRRARTVLQETGN